MKKANSSEKEIMVKKKVSVTIDEQIVRWMDDLIKRGLFRNRSHFIEESLKYVKKEDIKRIMLEKLEESKGL